MRERKWLLQTLALVSVATATPFLGAAEANAVSTANDRAGISKAAGSVTTHNGTVITGITFVSDKDLPAVRRQDAKSAAQTSTADAAVLKCQEKWYYIRAGATNTYWKPEGAFHYLWANGNRSADFWNQQFLPCYWTSWSEPNSWAFLANANGRFVIHGDLQLAASLSNATETFITVLGKFLVCGFDGNWISLYTRSNPSRLFAYRDPAAAALYQVGMPLNGNHLFYIDPPIASSYQGLCSNP